MEPKRRTRISRARTISRARRAGTGLLINGVLLALTAFMGFPFLWMLTSSFKPLDEIFTGDTFLPAQFTLNSYQLLFSEFNVGRTMLNSLVYAAAATALALFSSALSGYAFAKFRFPGRRPLFGLVLASMALPFLMILVPLFVLMRNVFHWINTPWPLILPAAATAFGIFYMRQYMLSFPTEVLDAARVDGATEARTFRSIVVPMSMPALAGLGLLQFLASWNAFLWPMAVLQSPEIQTLPILLMQLNGVDQFHRRWDLLMAGAVISVVPVVILVLVLRRRFVEGVSGGAVKG